MQGWSESRSRGPVPVPARPMGTTTTSIAWQQQGSGGLSSPDAKQLGGAGETVSSRPSGRLQYPTGSR